MKNRDRVLTALQHGTPDHIPYHVTFTDAAKRKMADYLGDRGFIAKLGNCFAVRRGTQDEWLRPLRDDVWLEVRRSIWRDEFGVEWDRTVDKDIGTVCNQRVTPENFKDYEWPDPHDPRRYVHLQETIDGQRDGFVLVFHGWSLFERAWTLVGMERLLEAMVEDRPFAHSLFDRLLTFNLELIDEICRYEVDAVRLGDDWGHQRGLIMGPALWREYIAPRFREMCHAVKSRGKYVFLHSCGSVQELFPDLIAFGVDVFHPFQPEVMDVYDMKHRYGDDLCFYGGISTQKTLPYGTVQETKDEVRHLLDVVGERGGFFAAPAHDIPGDAKPENVAAMIETLMSQ